MYTAVSNKRAHTNGTLLYVAYISKTVLTFVESVPHYTLSQAPRPLPVLLVASCKFRINKLYIYEIPNRNILLPPINEVVGR